MQKKFKTKLFLISLLTFGAFNLTNTKISATNNNNFTNTKSTINIKNSEFTENKNLNNDNTSYEYDDEFSIDDSSTAYCLKNFNWAGGNIEEILKSEENCNLTKDVIGIINFYIKHYFYTIDIFEQNKKQIKNEMQKLINLIKKNAKKMLYLLSEKPRISFNNILSQAKLIKANIIENIENQKNIDTDKNNKINSEIKNLMEDIQKSDELNKLKQMLEQEFEQELEQKIIKELKQLKQEIKQELKKDFEQKIIQNLKEEIKLKLKQNSEQEIVQEFEEEMLKKLKKIVEKIVTELKQDMEKDYLKLFFYEIDKINKNLKLDNNEFFINSLKNIIEYSNVQHFARKLNAEIIYTFQTELENYEKYDVHSSETLFNNILLQANKIKNIIKNLIITNNKNDKNKNCIEIKKLLQNIKILTQLKQFSTETSDNLLNDIFYAINQALKIDDIKDFIEFLQKHLPKIIDIAEKQAQPEAIDYYNQSEDGKNKIKEMSKKSAEIFAKKHENQKNEIKCILCLDQGGRWDLSSNSYWYFHGDGNCNLSGILSALNYHTCEILKNSKYSEEVTPVIIDWDCSPFGKNANINAQKVLYDYPKQGIPLLTGCEKFPSNKNIDENTKIGAQKILYDYPKQDIQLLTVYEKSPSNKNIDENTEIGAQKISNKRKMILDTYDWNLQTEKILQNKKEYIKNKETLQLLYDTYKTCPKNVEIEIKYGGNYYGCATKCLGLETFVKELKEKGFKNKFYLISLHLNECYENNYGENGDIQGMEVRVYPGLTEDYELGKEILRTCKNLITPQNRNLNKELIKSGLGGLVETKYKKMTQFAKKSQITTNLIHVDFADNIKSQYKLYDDDSMKRMAMGMVYAILKTLKLNPLYAIISIEPITVDEMGNQINKNETKFLVKASFENDKIDNFKGGKICIGRADIDKKNWNKESNSQELQLINKRDGKTGYKYMMLREFDPITQSANTKSEVDYDKKINNEFYLEVYDNENHIIPANVTNFKVISQKGSKNVEVELNEVYKFLLDNKIKNQKNKQMIK